MKINKLGFLLCVNLIFIQSSEAKRAQGFWRVFRESCVAEFNPTYLQTGANKEVFCDCLGRGFVKNMDSEKRKLLTKNEESAGSYLRFKEQLYAQGFGGVHSVVSNSCAKNTDAFK